MRKKEVIKLKVLPDDEAEAKILDYVIEHPGAWTSDVACDLGIDLDQTIRLLNKLKDEGILEGRATI